MRSLLSAKVYWNLAWRHLKSQKRQTFLTIAGSCIGAALIMASVIFFQSFDASGEKWLKQHYGPIEWELLPQEGPYFEPGEENRQIEALLQQAGVRILPVISLESRAEKVDGALNTVSAGARFLVMGLDEQQTASFDPENPAWPFSLAPDELVASKAVASQLMLNEGDVVMLPSASGSKHYFTVKKILPEEGMIGYRGYMKTEGTMIVTMDTARLLSGLSEGTYTSYLSRREHVMISTAPTPFPIPDPLVRIVDQKRQDADLVNQMKLRFGLTFVFCSVTAVIAGAILMLQVLLMLADSRKKMLAVLRAIGYQRTHIQRIFLIEALLIQGVSLLVGLAIGIPIGYGTIGLFQAMNGSMMQAYSGKVITITPYVSASGIALAGAIVFGLFMITAVLASIKLRKMRIVPSLREHSAADSAISASKIRFAGALLMIVCIAVVLLHIGLLVNSYASFQPTSGTTSQGGSGLLFVSWLLASVCSLYIVTRLLPVIQRMIRPLLHRIGVDEVAQLLAFRYPARHTRRSFFTMIIFSCCFMLLVIVLQLASHIQATMKQTSYEILGYPGYIAYENDTAKQRITKLLHADKGLAALVDESAALEPYMIKASSEGWTLDSEQFNMIPTNSAFLRGSDIALEGRASQFATDQEAWQAVLQSPQYIMLDHKYSYAPELWPKIYGVDSMLARAVQPGDKLTLQFYEKAAGLYVPGSEVEPKMAARVEVTVAGFVESNAGIAFYNGIWVNEQLHQHLAPNGYRWETASEKGYLFVSYPEKGLGALRELEQRLALAGISTFYAPAIAEGGSQLGFVQMFWVFNGFMVITMCIGLTGLAIVQLRAVQERSKVMAMLRCIGLGRNMIRQMVLLEGTMIGWTGIVNGLVFGTSGSYLIYTLMEADKKPTDLTVPYHFSWEILLPITILLLLVTWSLNVLPARRIMRLSPGEASRLSEE
ncbi:ABC transporter permease [Paenibacillus sp. NPDC058071]|uniref:ABC transporter permease n=1 Tax=Paenibacillus sp. NPDC058071 TaxID=3346326 RepID=UPI0036DED3E5